MVAALWSLSAAAQATLAECNAELLREVQEVHGLSAEQMDKIKTIFAGSGIIGQGNPAITQHSLTPEQCKAKLLQQGVASANPRFERICGAKYMHPSTIPPRKSRRTPKPAHAGGAPSRSLRRQTLELWAHISTGDLCYGKLQERGLQRRQPDTMRIKHVPHRKFPRVPQPAGPQKMTPLPR